MVDNKQQTTTATLVQFLEKERVAILRADFGALDAILKEKEALLKLIASLDVPNSELVKIRKLLSRNKNLLESSGQGLRTVSQRLAELRAAQTSIRTYSDSGQHETIGEPAAKVEWRA